MNAALTPKTTFEPRGSGRELVRCECASIPPAAVKNKTIARPKNGPHANASSESLSSGKINRLENNDKATLPHPSPRTHS